MAKSPMLADHDSVHTFPAALSFPLYASPKFDGFRCVNSEGRAVSRSFTDIRNRHTFKEISVPELAGLDGELIAGGTHDNIFNATSSAITTYEGEPVFEWHIFDDFTNPAMPYAERQDNLVTRLSDIIDIEQFAFVRYVTPSLIESWEELDAFEAVVLDSGFEGVITRSPNGVYKFGRSTKREQGMLKLKRFTDAEATVIGFVEATTNTNPDTRDNLGHAKRSKAKDGLVLADTLGTLQCRDILTDVEFEIGMFKGLTLADKKEIWDNREAYLGKLVKYQHLAHGAVDKPRHSKFLGWRDPSDL